MKDTPQRAMDDWVLLLCIPILLILGITLIAMAVTGWAPLPWIPGLFGVFTVGMVVVLLEAMRQEGKDD